MSVESVGDRQHMCKTGTTNIVCFQVHIMLIADSCLTHAHIGQRLVGGMLVSLYELALVDVTANNTVVGLKPGFMVARWLTGRASD